MAGNDSNGNGFFAGIAARLAALTLADYIEPNGPLDEDYVEIESMTDEERRLWTLIMQDVERMRSLIDKAHAAENGGARDLALVQEMISTDKMIEALKSLFFASLVIRTSQHPSFDPSSIGQALETSGGAGWRVGYKIMAPPADVHILHIRA